MHQTVSCFSLSVPQEMHLPTDIDGIAHTESRTVATVP